MVFILLIYTQIYAEVIKFQISNFGNCTFVFVVENLIMQIMILRKKFEDIWVFLETVKYLFANILLLLFVLFNHKWIQI